MAASRPGDNAAFGVEPQGYGVANRSAASPQDNQQAHRIGPPIWPAPSGNAFSVAVSWPLPGLPRIGLTQWLHRLVVGPAAAFRRNPGDIAVRVLHVAGFAVDAVLGVDLEARTRGFLDPFIDAGRAIA